MFPVLERENALPRMAIKKIWLTKTIEIYYGIIGGRHAGRSVKNRRLFSNQNSSKRTIHKPIYQEVHGLLEDKKEC
jgi:hypothetical protein